MPDSSLTQPKRTPDALGIRETSKGLLLPEGLTFEQWLTVGRSLGRRTNEAMWKVADWLFYGEWKWGETYKAAAVILGVKEERCQQLASLAGRFETSFRKENVSLTHHTAVWGLGDEDAMAWLDKAEHMGWSFHELREQLQDAGLLERKELGAGGSTVARTIYRVNADPDDDGLFTRAAERLGMDVKEWLLHAAREQARVELGVAA